VTGLSWGYCDDDAVHNGYITVGNTTILTISGGFHIATIDAESCSITSIVHFDTDHNITNSLNMANYAYRLPMSTILIGVTAFDATLNLEHVGKSALFSIGVNVDSLTYCGKVAFVAQIGRPSATVSRISPPGGNNLHILVSIPGNASLQSLTVFVYYVC